MIEPTVWMQLGISDDRYNSISKEIKSIIATNEKPGIMMEMIKNSKTMNHDEQLYAAFMVAKSDIQNKLYSAMPAFGKGIIAKIMEE